MTTSNPDPHIVPSPRPSRRPSSRRLRALGSLGLGTLLLILHPLTLSADQQLDVPSVAYPTLQDAVDAAANNNELNYINIVTDRLLTSSEVSILGGFNAVNQLVIRPSPGRKRAVIVSQNGLEAAFTIGASYVTLQDLDILRNSSNKRHLLQLSLCVKVVIERCRLGSIWPQPGASGWAVLYISAPREVTVRNCLGFAVAPGTFDYGIWGIAETASNDYLLLYNNDVADYAMAGIRLQGGGDDTRYVLRNNVVANHPNAPTEPYAFLSEVPAMVQVYSSHNTAFASNNRVEQMNGDKPIGGGAMHFLRFERPQLRQAFGATVWNPDPVTHPNPTFFRLVDGGPLHNNQPSVRGCRLDLGFPEPTDQAVKDDLERQPRPSGTPFHYDRGADQHEVNPSAITLEIVGRDVLLKFNGPPGRTLGIEASDDLVAWERIGSAEVGPEGQGQFTDINGAEHPERLYRTVFP